MSGFFSSGGKAAEPSGGGQRFFLGFPVSSFPAGWEALRPNCSVAHWDNKLAQSGISNLLENYFQNIFMKLAEKKLISLIAQTCLMLFKKILIL
jgi:hypothetical protein